MNAVLLVKHTGSGSIWKIPYDSTGIFRRISLLGDTTKIAEQMIINSSTFILENKALNGSITSSALTVEWFELYY